MVAMVGEEEEVLAFLTSWGWWFPFGFPCVWEDQHSFVLCSFLRHLKQSPSLMQQAWSAGESFFKWMASTSMASGSLMECELEEMEKRGKSCPFLRVMMQACCLWKLMALSIHPLRLSGTFPWGHVTTAREIVRGEDSPVRWHSTRAEGTRGRGRSKGK